MRDFLTLRQFLMEELANREEGIGYLNVALEEYQDDGDTLFFLKGIKTVVEAQGGISELVKRIHMSPDALQKILSSEKAPDVETFGTILKGLGYRLSIVPLETANSCSETTLESN